MLERGGEVGVGERDAQELGRPAGGAGRALGALGVDDLADGEEREVGDGVERRRRDLDVRRGSVRVEFFEFRDGLRHRLVRGRRFGALLQELVGGRNLAVGGELDDAGVRLLGLELRGEEVVGGCALLLLLLLLRRCAGVDGLALSADVALELRGEVDVALRGGVVALERAQVKLRDRHQLDEELVLFLWRGVGAVRGERLGHEHHERAVVAAVEVAQRLAADGLAEVRVKRGDVGVGARVLLPDALACGLGVALDLGGGDGAVDAVTNVRGGGRSGDLLDGREVDERVEALRFRVREELE